MLSSPYYAKNYAGIIDTSLMLFTCWFPSFIYTFVSLLVTFTTENPYNILHTIHIGQQVVFEHSKLLPLHQQYIHSPSNRFRSSCLVLFIFSNNVHKILLYHILSLSSRPILDSQKRNA